MSEPLPTLHRLKPFAAPAAAAQAPVQEPVRWRLEAGAVRWGDQLHLHYALTAAAGAADLPCGAALDDNATLAQPCRRNALWQHTCFEAFLAVSGENPYWEVNLAPSGDWNLYRLEGYRAGLRPEEAIATLPVRCRSGGGMLVLQAALPLPATLAAAAELEVNLCAVLESQQGDLSYWALGHPGPEADFHRRDGFSLRLDAPPPGR